MDDLHEIKGLLAGHQYAVLKRADEGGGEAIDGLYERATQRLVNKSRLDELRRLEHKSYHSREEFEEYLQKRTEELEQPN